MILLVKDHVQERNESFYAKIKVSAFVNFLVHGLKKMMKNRRFGNFPCILVAACFTCFESFTVNRNTRRAGCVSEKTCNYCIREFWAVIFVKA